MAGRIATHLRGGIIAAGLACAAGTAEAQFIPENAFDIRPNLNFYGVPGLIDMPTGRRLPDGEIAVSVSHFAGFTRGSLSFQLHPRILGTFRYSRLNDFYSFGPLYDRSFDVRFTLIEETDIWPGVVLGIQDLGGTGIYSGEYLVATRGFMDDRLEVTAGIGWGRYGSADSAITNPLGVIDEAFETRPVGAGDELGGQPGFDTWFRGDMGIFGGVAYDWNERLTLLAEYSSDAYIREGNNGGYTTASQLNFGVNYEVRPGFNLGAHYLYGNSFGVSAQLTFNPRDPLFGAGIEEAPPAVVPRPDRAQDPGAYDTAWVASPAVEAQLLDDFEVIFEAQDLDFVSYILDGDTVTIRYRNLTYLQAAQGVGRLARSLTRVLPPSVERIVLIQANEGIPTTAITLYRSDLEAFENAPQNVWLSYDRATITDATAIPERAFTDAPGAFPRFDWTLGPFLEASYFDPDQPLRLDFGMQANARYEPLEGLVFYGSVRYALLQQRGESDRVGNSQLPNVRTNTPLYYQQDHPYIPYLVGSYYFRPAENFYGRVTGGLLEAQYGGVSAEVLWQQPESPLALGVEVNYVQQRDFDQLFTFQDYDIVTGHASLYYQLQDYYVQVDAGRYLAGDWGATFTLSREFDNGVFYGAYATFTDVPFEVFGEGSFDKGIFLSIPVGWFLGEPTRRAEAITLQPILRDGGARVGVPGRLYGIIRDSASTDLRDGWGRFWR